jgi:restriction system protein
VARRKSLIEQILDDRRKARERRQREERQALAREARKATAAAKAHERAIERAARRAAAEHKAAERVALQAEREQERRRKERQRQEQQAEQGRIKQEAEERRRQREAEQKAKAEAARQRREEAEGAREQRRQEQQALADEVRELNSDLQLRLRELDGVLSGRPRQPVVKPWVLEDVFNRQGVDAFCRRLQDGLVTGSYPVGVPSTAAVVAYRPEARELIVERELPRSQVIPSKAEYRIVRSEVRPVVRKEAEVRWRYERLLASLALRSLDEVLRATPATLVDTVLLNGRVTAIDRSTGKTVTPLLLSVQVDRSDFAELRLDEPELDPVLCIKAQNALISPHPGDLVPVKPVLYYDLDRYKTIANAGLAVDLDSRLDLLTLTPNEFETLIRELFEKMGLRSWQTQSSRDDGIDAVAVNEDPVLGGLAIIQAKRYSKIVPYESVTALAGVMHDKSAAKGILVTTSWVGKSSRDFANRTGRMQIIEGRELRHLLGETLKMDVLISLPVLPPGWQRAEIA